MNIRRALGALVLSASGLTGSGAIAAEVDWSGFYAGVIVGGGMGVATQTESFADLSNTVDLSGLLGGVLLGYGVQFGPAVVALEADAALTSIAGTSPIAAGKTCFTGILPCHESLPAIATLRGKIGLDLGAVQPYVTGGLAIAYVFEGTGIIPLDIMSWHTGYVVGGGVEVIVYNGWAARGEYLYTNLGSATRDRFGSTGTNTVDNNHLFRVAVTKRSN